MNAEQAPGSSAAGSGRCLLLAGPTAVGKTEVAAWLGERLGGEIISVDSMQVYRGLDLGTAKPSAAARARVPHHLIDVVDLTEPFDAARFLRLAEQAVREIRARGRVPILCGGTGLYFKAFLHGLGSTPPPNPALRAELERVPLASLLAELARGDPDTYAAIDRANPRRVIRAVEVLRLTGRPLGEQQSDWSAVFRSAAAGSFCVGLCREPGDLHRRIDERVDLMFQQGLVAETSQLLGRGLSQNPTALQALGYRQVVEHLRGVRSLPDTVALVKTKTRQFAKRQMTWFRGQLRLRWIALVAGDSPRAVAERLAREFEAEGGR